VGLINGRETDDDPVWEEENRVDHIEEGQVAGQNRQPYFIIAAGCRQNKWT
jgi:hypothetical protein